MIIKCHDCPDRDLVCTICLVPEKQGAFPGRTVSVLNDGKSVFIVDDHCYVLKNWNGKEWVPSAYLFKEAMSILKNTLPENPDHAQSWFMQSSYGVYKTPDVLDGRMKI